MRDLDDVCPSRRTVLRSLAAIGGVALLPGVLVGCSSGGSGNAAPGSGSGSQKSQSVSVPASKVPVGQARIVDAAGERLVVAQPIEGEFVAFLSTCTHQGFPVEAGDGLTISCPNHGSQFDATDGSVVRGPATRSLETVEVTLEGDQLVFG